MTSTRRGAEEPECNARSLSGLDAAQERGRVHSHPSTSRGAPWEERWNKPAQFLGFCSAQFPDPSLSGGAETCGVQQDCPAPSQTGHVVSASPKPGCHTPSQSFISRIGQSLLREEAWSPGGDQSGLWTEHPLEVIGCWGQIAAIFLQNFYGSSLDLVGHQDLCCTTVLRLQASVSPLQNNQLNCTLY